VSGPASSELWVAYRRPVPRARLRLFCLPGAGSGPAQFRAWPEALAPQVEVCPVQLPGRERRLGEAPVDDWGVLVDQLDQGLAPLLDRPFAVLGHSFGALVGFELVRRLRDGRGLTPLRLFVAACEAPHLVAGRRPKRGEWEDEALVEELRRFGAPEEMLRNQELLELVLPAVRADFTLADRYRYRPGPALACPVSAFGGRDDPLVGREQLGAWRDQTAAGLRLRTLPGGHFVLDDARVHVLRAVAADLLGPVPA
jgi:medium-chain acyl-[acyl-carrier-protein] hydrolase